MAIVFYCGSGSPYAWRVWLALEHKGLPYELHMLSFDRGDLQQPGFVAMNPRGKVPVIQDGDYGLYESAAIVEYLEDAYAGAGAPLFPNGYGDRGRVPLYPQAQAEIMAGRRVLSPREFEMPRSLGDVVVGPETAQEIRWAQ